MEIIINTILAAVAAQIKQVVLVDLIPICEYVNNEKTDNIIGYKYVVVLPTFRYVRIEVKILGDKLIDYDPEQDAIAVMFDDLSISVYVRDGKVQLLSSASNIHLLQ